MGWYMEEEGFVWYNGEEMGGGNGWEWLYERERVCVYSRDNLLKRANGNLSHRTPKSQTGSPRVEGSEGGGSYNYTKT